MEAFGEGNQLVTGWGLRSQSAVAAVLCRRTPWAAWLEGEADEVGEIAEIGFLDGDGFYTERQGVWVGGDGDGGDFEEFLCDLLSPELLSAEFGMRRAESKTALTLDPSPI